MTADQWGETTVLLTGQLKRRLSAHNSDQPTGMHWDQYWAITTALNWDQYSDEQTGQHWDAYWDEQMALHSDLQMDTCSDSHWEARMDQHWARPTETAKD